MRALPRPAALHLGAFAGRTLHRSRLRYGLVLKNFRHVGYWDADELTALIRKLYITTGRYWADFLRPSSALPPHTVENRELIDELNHRGKGTLVILGHFGSWELLARFFGTQIPDLSVIARPMQNPYVEGWLLKKRTTTGISVIYPAQALRKCIQVVKRNGMMAMLIDQHSGKHGTHIPFLGKEANTIRTAAGLQVKTGCAILPAYAMMERDGSYRVVLERVEDKSEWNAGSEEEIITAWQVRHNEILSNWIRQYPEHWFGWFHRRFRASMKY